MRASSNSNLQNQSNHYQKIASGYDEKYNRYNSNHLYKIQQIQLALLNFLQENNEGYEILELGGGTGVHASFLINQFPKTIRRFTLSDISKEMLDIARTKLGDNVEYLVSTAESIATNNLFDAIYVSGAMHHFSDPKLSIKSIWEHLKPGGIVVVCEPIVSNPINFLKAVKDYNLEKGQFNVTSKKINHLLNEQGFSVPEKRVLHWCGPTNLAHFLWPYKKLELIHFFDPLAIMFLLVGVKDNI